MAMQVKVAEMLGDLDPPKCLHDYHPELLQDGDPACELVDSLVSCFSVGCAARTALGW